jgi:non-specific serine/threonine protein kinase
MLESVRDFALERLAASGEAEDVRARHAVFVAAFAEGAAPPWKPPAAREVARLAAEHDNARAALAWAVERGEAELGLRVAASYFRLWQIQGRLAEGRRWLEQVLTLGGPAPPSLRAAALVGVGRFEGNRAAAEAAYREALALVRTLPGPELPLVLSHLGHVARERGDLDEAEARYREALERARATVEEDWVFFGLQGLAMVADDRGDLASAVALVEEAVARCRGAGFHWGLAAMLAHLSLLARQQGDRRRAAPLDRERLAISRELGAGWVIAEGCLVAAEAAGWLREPERAARLLGAATALMERFCASLPPSLPSEIDAMGADVRAALGEAAFAAAWAAGQSLPLDEAGAEADAVFAAEEQACAPGAAPLPPVLDAAARSGLSPRELEVVRLVAAGRSNREIADALFISHGTATTHVRNVLAKLGLDSRTAVAGWAIRHGLD